MSFEVYKEECVSRDGHDRDYPPTHSALVFGDDGCMELHASGATSMVRIKVKEPADGDVILSWHELVSAYYEIRRRDDAPGNFQLPLEDDGMEHAASLVEEICADLEELRALADELASLSAVTGPVGHRTALPAFRVAMLELISGAAKPKAQTVRPTGIESAESVQAI